LDEQQHDRGQPTRALLARALARARGSLLWERLWPALATLATVAGLFLSLSWAGLWIVLPPMGRAIGLIVFLLITAAAAVPLLMLRLPSEYDGLRRLDRSSGETHRPATAIADEIAANQNDPVTQALWRAHVERALLSARKLKAGWPQPKLSLRDPMARPIGGSTIHKPAQESARNSPATVASVAKAGHNRSHSRLPRARWRARASRTRVGCPRWCCCSSKPSKSRSVA
jgi:hypothetical protein